MSERVSEENKTLRHGIYLALHNSNFGIAETANPQKFLKALKDALNVEVSFERESKGERRAPALVFKSRVIEVLSIAAKNITVEQPLSPESSSEEILVALRSLLKQTRRS